jgi:hypothetical protein
VRDYEQEAEDAEEKEAAGTTSAHGSGKKEVETKASSWSPSRLLTEGDGGGSSALNGTSLDCGVDIGQETDLSASTSTSSLPAALEAPSVAPEEDDTASSALAAESASAALSAEHEGQRLLDIASRLANATTLSTELSNEITMSIVPPTGGIVDSSGNAVDIVCVENDEGEVVCAPRKKHSKKITGVTPVSPGNVTSHLPIAEVVTTTSPIDSISAVAVGGVDSVPVAVAVTAPAKSEVVFNTDGKQSANSLSPPQSGLKSPTLISEKRSHTSASLPEAEAVLLPTVDTTRTGAVAVAAEATVAVAEADVVVEDDNDDSGDSDDSKAPKKLITAEERGEGAVGLGVYRSYLKASNKPALIALVLVSFVLANASQIGQQWVVSLWTTDVGYKKHPLGLYLGGVALMALAVAVFNWSRTYFAVMIGSAASRTLHNNMVKRVLTAPLGYFGKQNEFAGFQLLLLVTIGDMKY